MNIEIDDKLEKLRLSIEEKFQKIASYQQIHENLNEELKILKSLKFKPSLQKLRLDHAQLLYNIEQLDERSDEKLREKEKLEQQIEVIEEQTSYLTKSYFDLKYRCLEVQLQFQLIHDTIIAETKRWNETQAMLKEEVVSLMCNSYDSEGNLELQLHLLQHEKMKLENELQLVEMEHARLNTKIAKYQ